MRRAMCGIVGVATSVGMVLFVGVGMARAGCETDPCPPPPSEVTGPNDTVAVAQLLVLANADRAANNLPPLTNRDDVTSIAVDQSAKMAAAGDIWHNDGYFSADVRRRLDAKSLGENVAMNRDMEDAHRRLMASPGHRANLLDPRFTVVGFAVVRDANGVGYITEDFVEPKAGALGAVPPPAQTSPASESAPKPDAAPSTTSKSRQSAPTTLRASNPASAPAAPAAGGEPATVSLSESGTDQAVGAPTDPTELAAAVGTSTPAPSRHTVPSLLLALAFAAVAANGFIAKKVLSARRERGVVAAA